MHTIYRSPVHCIRLRINCNENNCSLKFLLFDNIRVTMEMKFKKLYSFKPRNSECYDCFICCNLNNWNIKTIIVRILIFVFLMGKIIHHNTSKKLNTFNFTAKYRIKRIDTHSVCTSIFMFTLVSQHFVYRPCCVQWCSKLWYT